MSRNISVLIMVIVLAACLFFLNNERIKKLRRAAAVETAKTNFVLSQFDDRSMPYDSVYAKDNTVLFYKKDSLVGRTLFVTE